MIDTKFLQCEQLSFFLKLKKKTLNFDIKCAGGKCVGGKQRNNSAIFGPFLDLREFF